jgi:TM2 domain-containing membrane protein YozV
MPEPDAHPPVQRQAHAPATDRRDFLHSTSIILGSVDRRMLCLVALVAGFAGAHKFYLGARSEGWWYLALAVTGVSAFAALMDLASYAFWPASRVPKTHLADHDVVSPGTWRRLSLAAALWLPVLCLLVLLR